jgi:hypothetical protein
MPTLSKEDPSVASGGLVGKLRGTFETPAGVDAINYDDSGRVNAFDVDLIAILGAPTSLASAESTVVAIALPGATLGRTYQQDECLTVEVKGAGNESTSMAFFSNNFDEAPRAWDPSSVSSAVVMPLPFDFDAPC